jgi:hypothetical protein
LRANAPCDLRPKLHEQLRHLSCALNPKSHITRHLLPLS